MILPLLVIIIWLVGKLIRKRHTYWSSRGVPQLSPHFILGDIKLNVAFRTQCLEAYRRFKEIGVKHGGIYAGYLPVYVPLDPEIVKCILVKNFECFRNRGHTAINHVNDPLSVNLVNLEDDLWKSMRAVVSQGFTAGKIKKTFGGVSECGQDLVDVFQKHMEANQPLNASEYAMRYTMDTMGAYIFGIRCHCLGEPEAEFKKYGLRIFDYSLSRRLRMLLTKCLPNSLGKHLKLDKIDSETEKFFLRVVREIITFRVQHNVTRNDFLQLLLEQKKNGKLKDFQEKLELRTRKVNDYDLEDKEVNLICAECFIFFAAGFELSSTTITLALYEIAQNQEVQKKLREEITMVLGKYGNEFSYESIIEMVYLDCTTKETLRKYPPISFMLRRCNNDFKVPGGEFVITKGMHVHLPIIGLHMDPEYYPDPERFDPNRFMDENWEKRPFYPFGDGPRSCIALRLGMIQVKLALASIIRNFEIRVSSKTSTPIRWTTQSLVPNVEGSVWLDVRKI